MANILDNGEQPVVNENNETRLKLNQYYNLEIIWHLFILCWV